MPLSWAIAILLFSIQQAYTEVTWVAVLQMETQESHSSLENVVSEEIRILTLNYLPNSEFSLMTKENMMVIMSDNNVNASCIQGSCEVDLGRNIGADWVVSGQLNSVQSEFFFSLKLHETANGELIGAVSTQADDYKNLLGQLPAMTHHLLAQGRQGLLNNQPMSLETISINGTSFTLGCKPEALKKFTQKILPIFSPEQYECSDNTIPAVSVELNHTFEILKHPITIEQWNYIADQTSLSLRKDFHYTDNLRQRPVIDIRWLEVIQYANELSTLQHFSKCYIIDGKKVVWTDQTCTGWRVPTEAEWEFAMRGSLKNQNVWSGTHGFSWNVPLSKYNDVCSLNNNDYGICDITDNVWEWTWDWYGPYTSISLQNTAGPKDGTNKVIRNGRHRSSDIYQRIPLEKKVSFRLVRTTSD